MIFNEQTPNQQNGPKNRFTKRMFSTGYSLSAENPNFISLLIIDESGSMSRLKQATVEHFNSIVRNILKEANEMPDLIQHMNVYTFSSGRINECLSLTTVKENAPIQTLVYHPNGGTPLYDAIGIAVLKLENLIKSTVIPLDNIKVSVAIFTDGLENDSRSYSLTEIQNLITRLKTEGWEFTYYGTRHAVDSVAKRMRVDKSVHFEHTETGIEDVMSRYNQENFKTKESYYNHKKGTDDSLG